MTILKIKKLENFRELTLPKYETTGSAGMDLTASIDEDIIIKSGEIKLIKTCGSDAVVIVQALDPGELRLL